MWRRSWGGRLSTGGPVGRLLQSPGQAVAWAMAAGVHMERSERIWEDKPIGLEDSLDQRKREQTVSGMTFNVWERKIVALRGQRYRATATRHGAMQVQGQKWNILLGGYNDIKSWKLPEYSVGGVSTPFLKMRSAEYSSSLPFKES